MMIFLHMFCNINCVKWTDLGCMALSHLHIGLALHCGPSQFTRIQQRKTHLLITLLARSLWCAQFVGIFTFPPSHSLPLLYNFSIKLATSTRMLWTCTACSPNCLS